MTRLSRGEERPTPDGLVGCVRCRLSASRARVVVGVGPARARLVVVGEAPGRAEDEGGEPFVGRSGQLLMALLGEIGVARDDCFITNAVKCRPPHNRTPRADEIAVCRGWLDHQLAGDAAPVLAVGAVAARALWGERAPLAAHHGRVRDLGGRVGLATYHPAAALRGGPNVVRVMREDLAVLATVVAT